MNQSVPSIQVHTQSLTPAEAEIWVTAVPEKITPTTEIRGRVVGPHCLFASTVEIAYPFKPFPRLPAGVSPWTRRVVIPEPNLWDPQSPFLYRIIVEIWQDGEQRQLASFNYGLRSIQRTARGLRLNGHPLSVRGTTRWPGSTESAIKRRNEGYNLAVIPGDKSQDFAIPDQVGILVLTQMPLPDRASLMSPKVETVDMPNNGCPASLFGMLWGPDLLDLGSGLDEWLARHANRQWLVGIEVNRAPIIHLPEAIHFMVCRESLYPELAEIALPRIVFRDREGGRNESPPWAAEPGFLGWIDS
jgi:hypothetical protein